MQKFGFVFPGQGSQKLGMLSELGAHNPMILDTFAEASAELGVDLWAVCQLDRENILDRTDITQPAILTAAVALWRLWQSRGAPTPSILAGHSLGEYSALVCADVIDFSAAVRLVNKRGEFMQQAVPAGQGAMAAIVGLDDYRISEICASVAASGVVSAANFNSPGQTVIAGDRESVDRAMEACKAAGAKRALPLKVSVPSHCALMQPAAERLAAELERVEFRAAQIPVVQNVGAQIATGAAAIKTSLLQQLYEPVRWVDSIRLIHAGGIKTVVECGPGKVLCGLVKRIEPAMVCFGTEDSQSFQEAIDGVSA